MSLSSERRLSPVAAPWSSQGADRVGLKLSNSSNERQEDTMNLYGPKQLADSMRTVRKNTILIAEDIPEKDYSYRPTPESRSVAEILVHIASLALFDRLVHEEQHLSSLEGFDFGAAIKKSKTQEGLS